MSKTFLLGAATGAAAMYLLDPNKGRERRLEVERLTREAAESPTGQRISGAVTEVTRPLHDSAPDPESDPALADKVRSEVLGKPEYRDLSLNVDAVDGTVSVRGSVDDPALRTKLLADVRLIGGVKHVESHLDDTDSP